MASAIPESIPNMAQNAVSAMANNPALTGVGLGLGAVAVIVALSMVAYENLQKVPPLSEEDLARHRDLIKVYKHHFPKAPIPPEWILTKDKPGGEMNKPKGELDFILTGDTLKNESESLIKTHTRDSEARAMMLNHIANLFISMSNRSRLGDVFRHGKWHKVRPDGVEVMFYQEMTNWLLKSAPNLQSLTAEKVAEYNKRLQYLKSIEQRVLTGEASEQTRNNPHATLTRLIANFRNYHDRLLELQQAKSFNALVSELDDLVLGLSSRALDVMYLLIRNVPGNMLMVDKFLSPESTDPKIKKILKTRLGKWLNETVKVAGVSYSKFEPSRMLSLKTHVKEHLSGRHPSDANYSEKTSMLNSFSDVWGCHQFMTEKDALNPDGVKKAEKYLLQIRELHRLILELYFLSQNLLRSSRASENFGDVWMYGNRGAKANLMELLDSVTELTELTANSYDSFWNEFYHKDFRQGYEKKHKINLRQKEYVPLVHIDDTLLPEMKEIKEKIDGVVVSIRQKVVDFVDKTSFIEESKIQFFEGVLEHREYRQKTTSNNYLIAKAELNLLRQNRGRVVNREGQDVEIARAEEAAIAAASPPTPIIPNSNRLAKALRCLATPKDKFVFHEKYNCLPNIREDKFYSDFQRNVFNTMIKKYNSIVNNRPSSDFWLGSLNYKSKKFEDLRHKYACLYDAFEALYLDGNVCSDMSATQIATFKEENRIAIYTFDQQLQRFIADIEHLELLFQADSHMTHADVASGKYNALQIVEQESGDYAIEPNSICNVIPDEVVMKTITPPKGSTNIFNQKHLHQEKPKSFMQSVIAGFNSFSLFNNKVAKQEEAEVIPQFEL
ncbi:MAG: hypothetical protein Q8R24_00865 [Legionellaceae bacterium]|nr:hypothetical protein [Legionellaceae bacterium]